MNFPLILIMGVSGSGKTTVGELLAKQLNLPFYDGDDFHPAANVKKMAHGTPLTDADRAGWLATLAAHLGEWSSTTGAVVACSALKEAYRQTLQAGAPDNPLRWVFLDGTPELLRSRIEGRQGHYMKANMLASQLADLEKPTYGLRLDVKDAPKELVRQILAGLKVNE